MTKLDRQQMQGNDVMSLLYFDINLYHLRTRRDTGSRDLRACPPEDQAEVIHAISPISVKLGQIEGLTQ